MGIPDLPHPEYCDGGSVRLPQLTDAVLYRGKRGLQAMRAAIVIATVDSLDPRGVAAGEVPALNSAQHVHLHVLTPSDAGFFTEYNVSPGDGPGEWQWPGEGDASEVEGGVVHAIDGWTFQRRRYGSVTIRSGPPHHQEVTFDPHMWASIVAEVAATDADGAAYGQALALHMGAE